MKKDKWVQKATKEAQNSEWCDLAHIIMALEIAVCQEKDPKMLELLKIKLEIFEHEKNERVFEEFDINHFLYREYEDLEDIDVEISDI